MNCPKCTLGPLDVRYCATCTDDLKPGAEHLHFECPKCGFRTIEATGVKRLKHRINHRVEKVPVFCFTRTQVCEALQIGVETFDTWSHRHGFPVIRDGKTILVPIDSLQEWLRQQAASTNGEPETLADRVAGFRARSA